jgi:hypothetical protein
MGQTTSGIQSNEKIVSKLKDLTNYLLSQHMESLLKGDFCKKIKLFVKDEVFMKFSEKDLLVLADGQNVIIGKEIDNSINKEELCKNLTNLYLKKLNIIACINWIISYSIDYINKLENGPRCYKDIKNNISKFEYKSGFESTHSLEQEDGTKITFPVENTIIINDINVRETAYAEYLSVLQSKGIVNNLDEGVRTHNLITELPQNLCSQSNNKWVEGIQNLIDNKIIPDPALKDYNRTYLAYITQIKSFTNKNFKTLLGLLNNIIEEQTIIIKRNNINVKETRFIEKHLSLDNLNKLIETVKGIIKNILIQLNKTSLLVFNTQFITIKEIEHNKKLANDKIELDKKIKASNKQLKSS